MAESLAAGESVPEGTIAAINEALATGASVLRLERRGDAYVTTRHVLAATAATVLAPVAESAAWLLERGNRSQVRRCENPACILFFYDTTKNKRRRWCAMEACGSRAKAAAYYRRVARRTQARAAAKEAIDRRQRERGSATFDREGPLRVDPRRREAHLVVTRLIPQPARHDDGAGSHIGGKLDVERNREVVAEDRERLRLARPAPDRLASGR